MTYLATFKICARCREHLGASAYRISPYSSDGLDSWCIECRREYSREWRARKREEARRQDRTR
jgi:hypothetical protein